jgi:hypothetical protein
MELRESGKGKENDTASAILHTIRCDGRGYKGYVLKAVENGVGGKGVRRVMEGVE